MWNTYNTTTDGFLIIGAFNDFGIAEGVVDPKIGELKELRLHVYSDSQNWVILREVANERWRIFAECYNYGLFQILLQDNTVRWRKRYRILVQPNSLNMESLRDPLKRSQMSLKKFQQEISTRHFQKKPKVNWRTM